MKNDKSLLLLISLLAGALLLAALGLLLIQNPDEGLPWEEPTHTSTNTPLPPTETSTPTATSTGTRRPTRTPVLEPSVVMPTETITPSLTTVTSLTPETNLTPTPAQTGIVTPGPAVLTATPTHTPTVSQTAVSAGTPTVSPTPHTGPSTIVGRVVNEGNPISNVTITLEGSDILTATTGADGAYQFDVDWPDAEFSVVFSLDSNPQLSPRGDYVSWSWIESIFIGYTTMPDLEISTTPAGTLFSQTSPANGSYYSTAQITAANPLTFEWTAYPQAEEYWVDLGLDGNDFPLWSSDAVATRFVDFDGTLINSARISQGTYWWAVGSIRTTNDFRILTYTQIWTLYITP